MRTSRQFLSEWAHNRWMAKIINAALTAICGFSADFVRNCEYSGYFKA
jgi:hypothetical protein